MSTVLPLAAALPVVPVLVVLLLLLLVQPTTATAIAAKAAITVVRLMIFLSLLRLSCCRGVMGPNRAGQCAPREQDNLKQ